MKSLSLLILLAAAAGGLPQQQQQKDSSNDQKPRNEFFESFLQDFLDWKHEVSPEGASLDGLHQYDSALGDSTVEGAKVRMGFPCCCC